MTTANFLPKTRLTAKQEAFIVNYVISGNATQSAIKAGYSPRTAAVSASENLNKPYVIERRAQLEEKIAAAKLMPERERREKLAEIARELHFQPVTAADRIRAIDTLNKLDKLYADNISPPAQLIQNVVFVFPDGMEVTPKELLNGNRRQPADP